MDSIRNVTAKNVEADEQWFFVAKKARNHKVDEKENVNIGSQWIWIAMESSCKLVLGFTLGERNEARAMDLMHKVRRATSPASKFQMSTDGLGLYENAVDMVLRDRCSFAQLVKTYTSGREAEVRYSPSQMVCATKVARFGNPDMERVCTSYVERLNLTNRMQVRRLTRLTNAFSKKFENLQAALSLHFAYYNWCKLHRSIRVTPAMESG